MENQPPVSDENRGLELIGFEGCLDRAEFFCKIIVFPTFLGFTAGWLFFDAPTLGALAGLGLGGTALYLSR